MIERSMTWQNLIASSNYIKRFLLNGKWNPEQLVKESPNTQTLITFTEHLNIYDMRDWVSQSIGNNFTMSGIFIREVLAPQQLRFSFADQETAFLFKLVWYS